MRKLIIILISIFILFGCSVGSTEVQNPAAVEQNITIDMITDYLADEKLETKEDWLMFLGLHGIGLDNTDRHHMPLYRMMELYKISEDFDIKKEFYKHVDEGLSIINEYQSTTETLCLMDFFEDERIELCVIKVLEVNENNVVYSAQNLYYDYDINNEEYVVSSKFLPILQIITIPKEYKIVQEDRDTTIVFDNCKIMQTVPQEYVKEPKLDDSYELYYEGPISADYYNSLGGLLLIEEKALDGTTNYKLLNLLDDEIESIKENKKDWIFEKSNEYYNKYVFIEKDTRAKENMEAIFKEGKGTWTIDFIQDVFGEDDLPFSPDGEGGFYEGEVTGEGYLTCDKFYDDYCTMHFRLGAVEGDFDFYYKDMPHVLIENIKFKSSGPGGYAYAYGALDMTYNE